MCRERRCIFVYINYLLFTIRYVPFCVCHLMKSRFGSSCRKEKKRKTEGLAGARVARSIIFFGSDASISTCVVENRLIDG